MHPMLYLPFMLPTLYTLQMVSLCVPWPGPSHPAVRDTFASDLE